MTEIKKMTTTIKKTNDKNHKKKQIDKHNSKTNKKHLNTWQKPYKTNDKNHI